MTELLSSPLFGILISLLAFEIGIIIYRKTKLPIFNPLLTSIILIIILLHTLEIPYEAYSHGGNIILFFLGPATVILAVPLYKQISLLKKNLLPILFGITVGSITAISSVWFLAKLFRLDSVITVSIVPKSVTTPIGIEISNSIGGIPAITVTAIIITGIMGAIFGPTILKIFGIKDEVATGVAMGTASHAVGTTKAMELGETQGAMSSLSIGLAGLITVFIVPIFMKLFID